MNRSNAPASNRPSENPAPWVLADERRARARPVRTRAIEMSSAELDEADIQAVLGVLRSGRLALGPKVAAFERSLAAYVGVKHAVAVGSGTAALHLIVKALGIGPGEEVLVPSFTFAASVNAFLYEGAVPVFVELEPDTCNLDIQDLELRITPRTRGGRTPSMTARRSPYCRATRARRARKWSSRDSWDRPRAADISSIR